MKTRTILKIEILVILVVFVYSLVLSVHNLSTLNSASASPTCNAAINGTPCAKTDLLWPAFSALVISSIFLGGLAVAYVRPRHF